MHSDLGNGDVNLEGSSPQFSRKAGWQALGDSVIMKEMSLSEIIEELPRLSLHERRALVRTLMDLEPGREDLRMCDHLADEAMQMLDRMEDEDRERDP